MAIMRVLVLGGYGAMAQVIVRDLVESDAVDEVIIAGRNLSKAKGFGRKLKNRKARPTQIDVQDKALEAKIRKDEPDVVINSTWYQYNMTVMSACIKAGVHYLDLGGLYHMTLKQLKLDNAAKKAGVTCILGMGSTPGITNVMGAYGASKLDKIGKVEIRSGSAVIGETEGPFQAPYSIRTVLDEFTQPAIVLKNGKVVEVPPLSGKETFEFKSPIGKVAGYYTIHSELATMPQNLNKGVRNMDFIVAYPPEFTETVTALVKVGVTSKQPVLVGGRKVVPYEALSEVIRRIPPPEETIRDADGLRVDLYGERNGSAVKLRYDSVISFHERWQISGGTVDTGVPPSIIAQWLGAGRISKRGVLAPEQIVEPPPFFRELATRDREIEVFEIVDDGEPRPLF